jgi:hypothetical protein
MVDLLCKFVMQLESLRFSRVNGEGGIRTLGTKERLRPDRFTYETEHA